MVDVTFYIVAFIVVLALCIPLLMVLPTYIYEDISVWKAYARGLRLGWKTWVGIFALGFVLTFISKAIFLVSISYLYSHAAEKLDDMSVAKGIDDFEGMADSNPDDDDLFKQSEPLV